MADVKIKSALISVFDKGNLESIVTKLNDLGVSIYSTGGTQTFIEGLGVGVERVEDLTNYPSILGGRVKTLHPKIHAGILNKRNNKLHNQDLKKYNFKNIDLVVVNFYPFENTLKNSSNHKKIIENIDIGGPTMVRAAAKNYNDVAVITSR